MLLEGPRVVAEARAAGVPLALLAVREGDSYAADAEDSVTLARGVFREVSTVVTPQGVIAVARVQPATAAEARAAAAAAGWPLVVLDGVQDPSNVGAIARTAAAAGAPALLLLPGTADAYSPRAVRASAGNVLRLTVARGDWPDLEGLSGAGAAATGGEPPDQVDLAGAGMIVLGGEARGLRTPEGLRLVTIPLAPGVESLNVAAAAALLLFEIERQRG